MLCDDCGRNEATVHIVQIGPDGRVEKNLCQKCAAAYGNFVNASKPQRDVSMDDFLKGIFSSANKNRSANAGQTELICPSCGMSYREVKILMR